MTNDVGKIVLDKSLRVTGGIETTSLKTAKLASGVYFVSLINQHGERIA